MKWYFCLNDTGLVGFAETVIAAAHSAIQNTTLEPHFIFDGKPNEMTRYLESIGVIVHYHENSFLGRIVKSEKTGAFSPEIARGAYLRLDIPNVDPSDDLVLYTDCDVLFVDDPDFTGITPQLLAAAPEYADIEKGKPKPFDGVMNSGVMVINLKGFRQELHGLLDFAEKHNFYFHGNAGFYDQGALNHYLAGRWDKLPQRLNWRPFGKSAEPPEIIHFHGTKPWEIAALAGGGSDAAEVRPVAKLLYEIAPANYITAIGAYGRFLTPEAVSTVRHNVPGAKGVTLGGVDIHRQLNDLCSFYFENKRISASTFYDSPYLKEFKNIIQTYLAHKNNPVRVLEWGSGFTTLLTSSLLDSLPVPFHIDSLDNYRPYQESLQRWVYGKNRINWVLEELTGPGKSQRDPELNYSSWPLSHGRSYDFIFIDGRRRVECAYIASLIAEPDTVVVIHDFRRGRYQPVLGLFDVIEETEQFRVLRIKPAVHQAIDLSAVRRSLQEAASSA